MFNHSKNMSTSIYSMAIKVTTVRRPGVHTEHLDHFLWNFHFELEGKQWIHATSKILEGKEGCNWKWGFSGPMFIWTLLLFWCVEVTLSFVSYLYITSCIQSLLTVLYLLKTWWYNHSWEQNILQFDVSFYYTSENMVHPLVNILHYCWKAESVSN
jgi:hypothetical protein